MRRLSFVPCLVGLLIATTPAFAQRTTGDVVGTVSDNTGAVLPGVTVTLEGENVQGSQTATTSGRGFYRFNRLFPGSYNLNFSMDGFAPAKRSGVRVNVGFTTEENVTLSLGAVAEQLTVSSSALVVDRTDTGLSDNYDVRMVTNLPLRRTSIYDLMRAAPGITTDSEEGNLMSMGSETDGNAFQLDGISINSRSQGRTWLSPNPDIVAEVEVIALGAPAEYGHAPGAVFNVVTKQGTNSFRGDVGIYFQTDSLTGRNTDDDFDNGHPYFVDEDRDFTAQLGGPIAKDKLWFFLSYQDKAESSAGVGVPEEFPVGDTIKAFFGKLNFQINPNHNLVAAWHQDWYSFGSNSGPDLSPSWGSREYGRTPAPSVAYTGVLSEATLLEVRAGGFYGRDHYGPIDESQRRDGPWFYNYAYGGDCSTGPCLYTGGPDYWYDLDEKSTSATVALSHYADNWLGGSHDFKFGVQYLRAGRENAIVGYTDWFALYLDDNGDEYVFGTDYNPFSYGGIANNRSVFFDDTFRVNDRLTLKLGARYDYDRASVPDLLGVDLDGNPTGEVVTPGIDNLYDYSTFSPRLGFTYALTDDGRTLLKGHYGRYSRGIVTMDFAGGPGNIATTDFVTSVGYYDPAGFHAETLEGDGRGIQLAGAANNEIDPDIHSTYTDQYIIGLERELSRNLGVSLTYVHKRGEDFPAWQEVAGTYAQEPFTDPTTGVTNTLSILTSDPEDVRYRLGNPEFMDTRVHSVAVAVTKRMSDRWQLNSSFQFLRSTGSLASGATQNRQGRQDGGVAWRDFGKSPNNFVNIGGRLIGDMPIYFKTQAFVELGAGFLAGANYVYASGGAWGRTTQADTSILGAGYAGGRRETILLEEKDGSRRWENRSLLDLRLQKTFNLGSDASFVLTLDGYNVLNNGSGQRVRSTRVTSSSFGLPTSIVLPRRLQIGARFRF